MENTFYLQLVLFVGLINSQAFSQEQPYQYDVEVKYRLISQPDSTDRNSVQTEFMTLLIGKAQSLFCATQYLVMDSAITAELVKGNTLGPSFGFLNAQGTKNTLVVFKNSSQTITYERASRFVDQIFFSYPEARLQFDWTILADTMSIGGIPCQKASTVYGNRIWHAWFAPSIPIQDGPYKFIGLPGLILKVNDSREQWNFDLASIRNVNKTVKIGFSNSEPQHLKSKEEYLSKKKHLRDNTVQLLNLRWGMEDNAANRKHFGDIAAKDNNWIELYKGK